METFKVGEILVINDIALHDECYYLLKQKVVDHKWQLINPAVERFDYIAVGGYDNQLTKWEGQAYFSDSRCKLSTLSKNQFECLRNLAVRAND